MIPKKVKEDIKDMLAWVKCRATGFDHINGGYAEIKKMRIKKLGPNHYVVAGVAVYGEQDMGEGCSSRYTEDFEDVEVVKRDGEFVIVKG